MIWVDLVIVAALFQYLAFGLLVALARGRYGVAAPATTGHPLFERAYRIQTNTLELLIAFLPALWLAATYWPPEWMAAIGAVYVLGRVIYFVAYTRDPAGRSLGFMLSLAPVTVLLGAALVGMGLRAARHFSL